MCDRCFDLLQHDKGVPMNESFLENKQLEAQLRFRVQGLEEGLGFRQQPAGGPPVVVFLRFVHGLNATRNPNSPVLLFCLTGV